MQPGSLQTSPQNPRVVFAEMPRRCSGKRRAAPGHRTAQAVSSRIDPGIRIRPGNGRNIAKKEKVKKVYDITDVHLSVVVNVSGIRASRSGISGKKPVKVVLWVRNICLAVAVKISADKCILDWRRRRTNPAVGFTIVAIFTII